MAWLTGRLLVMLLCIKVQTRRRLALRQRLYRKLALEVGAQLLQLLLRQGWQQLHVAVADVLVPATEAHVLHVWYDWLRILPNVAEVAAHWAGAHCDAAAVVVDPAGREGICCHCAAWEPCCLQGDTHGNT
jgi:hypothetical protein